MHRIRDAQADEVETLVEIERRSSQRFAQVEGLTGWIDDITPSELVHVAINDGLAWVAELIDSGELVGWCFASIIDDSLFVEQVDVLPEFGRRGIGQSLLTAVEDEAKERGLAALTLTTDAHVEWNRPWYEKLGFTVVSPGQRGPGVATAVAQEVERGFDISRRVAMRREIRT